MKTIKQLMLEAPEGQMCKSVKSLIEKWDDEPTAIQILETLDNVIYAGAGSGFVVMALQAMFKAALEKEGKTSEEVEALAVWRKGLV